MALTNKLSMCSIARRMGEIGKAAIVGIGETYSFAVNQERIFENNFGVKKELEIYTGPFYSYKNKV
jgi:hypothetical protein